MTTPRDRLELLRASSTLNGIDFVEVVGAAQTELRVHFLNPVPDLAALAALAARIEQATITGGEAIRTVAVQPFGPGDWNLVAAMPVLTLRVAAPGDFSNYTLTLITRRPGADVLDRYFERASFSFKAGCPSTLDCKAPPIVCPPEPSLAPPIDYLAKDFLGFRQALLDFSSLRYPEWQERSEADFGMMFLESLASLGDDLSYLQDRIAAESALDTATERRSVVRHARLVDYEPRPATAARVLLRFDVAAAGAIPTGLLVSARSADGEEIPFETGEGLRDEGTYPVSPLWDPIAPYYWDDGDRCLRAGATDLWIERPAGLVLAAGQRVLVETAPLHDADPPIRELATLAPAPEAARDELRGVDLFHVFLREPLRHDHDLTRTTLSANLVPATQGRRRSERFSVISGAAPSGVATAIVRTGPNTTRNHFVAQVLHTLEEPKLTWLAPSSDPAASPLPEIRVFQRDTLVAREWAWVRSLLKARVAAPAFTVDPARYTRLGPLRYGGKVFRDYDGKGGETLRFGDGAFGASPTDGMLFEAFYRVGCGAVGNVAPDTLTRVEASGAVAALIKRVSNPFAASGGADEETEDEVRRLAPQAFRAVTYRAVRTEDYQAAAETLPWVQRAGATFRHTGSWLTAFTAVDPVGTGELTPEHHLELIQLLDRYRLAGYDAYALPPRFAALDLEVTVCARPDAFRGELEAALWLVLGARISAEGAKGFFHVDNFTFGQPIERSVLEAAIQRVPGVQGVHEILYRRRGTSPAFVPLPDTLRFGMDEILRVDSDRSRPERGSVRLQVKGGK